MPKTHDTEIVAVANLKPHDRNYRTHPQDQIDHLIQSIKDHGFYRNIVIAKDDTILAGHGVVEACRQMGIKEIPAVRMNIGPNTAKALKLLAADNYLDHLAMDDDRMLTDLLKELRDGDHLFGTGFDEAMLGALAMVTRTAHEIRDFDAAAEWVGMPDYEAGSIPVAINIQFDTEAERLAFIDSIKLDVRQRTGRTWSTWYPPRDRDDISSLRWSEATE